MSMIFVGQRGWVISAVLGAAVAAGCSGAASVSPDPGGANAAQDQLHAGDPGEQLRQRFHAALGHLSLRPDQKTEVDKLEGSLDASRTRAKTSRDALHAAVPIR